MKWIHGKVSVPSRQLRVASKGELFVINQWIFFKLHYDGYIFLFYMCCLIKEDNFVFLLLEQYGASYLNNLYSKILEKQQIFASKLQY